MRIGFIGAGKAGCSFGKFITETAGGEGGDAAVSVSGYYSRTPRSAVFAAELTGSRAFENAEEVVSASDVIILTVPDGAVAETWRAIRDLKETDGKTFCHMSGSLSSLVFGEPDPAPDDRGRCFCSLHPMLALADKELSGRKLDSAYFTFDGSDEAYERVRPLIDALGIRAERIDAGVKMLYHAACVCASNLVCALAYDAEKLLKECGLSDEFASAAWKTLFAGNAENIVRTDPVTALTGPVERGDRATVAAHVEALAGRDDIRESYVALTKTLTEMAREKHEGG
jgi:predicted short-subunit dehydrogenase-like oxidoreductase (DUF2520 family)